MLGKRLHDPDGLDGPAGTVEGLGLLDVETVMTPEKSLTRVRAEHLASGEHVSGYEIHIGRTHGPDTTRPFARIDGTPEGAVSPDGRICGTYLHGLFAEDRFRSSWLRFRGISASGTGYAADVDRVLDELAAHLEAHVKIDELLACASEI